MINFNTISRHTIFLHGTSGSGKSVVQEAISSSTAYYKHRNLKLIYLSSGDCFRELAERNKELANNMRAGLFIPTLNDIMPILEDKLHDFIQKLEPNDDQETPILMLDGFLRIGSYKENGVLVPSQIDQVANAFKNVVAKMIQDGEKLFDKDIVNLFNDLGNPVKSWHESVSGQLYEQFRSVVKNSHHYYVDVTEEDAEVLMRFRSEKAFKALITKIEGREGRLADLREVLSTALLIQQGKYKSLDRRNVEIAKDSSNNFSLKPVPKTRRLNLDEHMARVIRKTNKIAGLDFIGDNLSLTGAIKKIAKEEGVNIQGIPLRDDDLTFKSREKRIKEFKEKTVEGLLINELGFSRYEKGIIIPPEREGTATIVNGPNREISYESFRFSALSLAGDVIRSIQIRDKRRIYLENASSFRERA